jgi:putative chitinase
MLTVDELIKATGAERADALIYCHELNLAMEAREIHPGKRTAAFLSTVAVESMNLSVCEESLYYKDAERLASIYKRAFKGAAAAEKYVKNPKGLSDLLYQGFHGRGLIQLTWKKNYQAAGDDLGFDYVAKPELLLEPKHAALTAAWFWDTNGCNAAADRGDMRDVTRRVNGPALMHLAERTAQYNKNMEWMLA